MSNVTHHEERIGELGKEVRDSARSAKNAVQSKAADIRDAASETFDNVRDKASDYLEQGRDKARELEESFEAQIQDRPLSAVLIAAGFGFVIGMLCTRR